MKRIVIKLPRSVKRRLQRIAKRTKDAELRDRCRIILLYNEGFGCNTIAERVGLSANEARAALEQRRFREAVDADWQRSRELGITGVPTFVIGNHRLVGAQSYEQLAALATLAGVSQREP